MKKVLIIFLLMGGIYACNSGGTETKTDEKTATTDAAKPDPTTSPEFTKGLELVKSSDCATCHKVDEKVNGPAFRDVANKYTKNDATVDSLAHKVITGGAGNWGPVAMTPHPSLSLADAKAMVTYVLLLKNN